MILTTPHKIKGKIIAIPNEILIIKGFAGISDNTHFTLDYHPAYNMTHTFKIITENGKEVAGYLLAESFLNMKYVSCSLAKYEKIKAFL